MLYLKPYPYILIYLAVPRVYLSNKEKEADIIISELTQKINEENTYRR